MRFSPRRHRHALTLAVALVAIAGRSEAQTTASTSSAPFAATDPSATIDQGRPKPFAMFSASLTTLRDSVIATARSQIGTRYKLGGDKPGSELDCSALVRFVMGAFNVSLPRTARQQATVGEAVPKDLGKLVPGDLLTFGKGKRISHIGIYVGEGRMVHASTSSRKVIETALTTRNPLIKQWTGVRRVVGTASDSILALAFRDSL